MPIPFVKDYEFTYEQVEQVSLHIRRVVARNPGPFTYTGTNVFIIGKGEVAILDPGPIMPEHEQAIDDAIRGEKLTHVFVTHHHIDHSPYASPLAKKYGAKVYGYGAPLQKQDGGSIRLEAGDDLDFKPDICIQDGDIFKGLNWTLKAHYLPGHASNHMCYSLEEENAFFSGDHIMGWSTSIVSPPDGQMSAYLKSLQKTLEQDYNIIWPTHGPPIHTPKPFIKAYIQHRKQREKQIIESLKEKPKSIKNIVSELYADIDKKLHPAACHSVLAHMIHLAEQNLITYDTQTPSIQSIYELKKGIKIS